MQEDGSDVVISETRTVLRKFDANEADIENATPLEEVHLIDDEIVKHVVGDEVRYDKEAGIGEKPDFSVGSE